MSLGALLVWLATLWLYAGAVVAIVFLLFGIDRVMASARGAYAFRPLLVPGVILLWPLVLLRWLQLETRDTPPSVVIARCATPTRGSGRF